MLLFVVRTVCMYLLVVENTAREHDVLGYEISFSGIRLFLKLLEILV